VSYKKTSVVDRIDWTLVILFLVLSIIGVACIYSVEHRDTDISFFMSNRRYTQQFIWLGISLLFGFVIILLDSKFITAIPFLSYVVGFIFLLLTLTPLGKAVKGSSSFLNLGIFTFQPGELMKLFAALAIAKFLSLQNTNFSTVNHRLTAAALALVPMLYIMLFQNETGLALVYLSFFIAMYREGLPNIILIIGFSVFALTIATLLIPKNYLFIILSVLAVWIIWSQRKQIKRNKEILFLVAGIWFMGVLFSQVMVPIAFKKVLKGYQVQRIYTMIGQDVPEDYLHEGMDNKKQNAANYNVSQSKIAIASGGFFGKGFLNGTQTQYNWVPEQGTDFIFCTIGEQFGFVGSVMLMMLYVGFLLRIIFIAERQRSVFSRVYCYGIGGIMFFHLIINIGMTVGLAPVIGIPLPLLSYGGTSLLTFAIMIVIMVRLDMDRQMVLR
jgi:rod shape determining protein RodA